jgi:hypothetical protein
MSELMYSESGEMAYIRDEQGGLIFAIKNKEQAKKIIHRYNAHDELVGALKEILEFADPLNSKEAYIRGRQAPLNLRKRRKNEQRQY